MAKQEKTKRASCENVCLEVLQMLTEAGENLSEEIHHNGKLVVHKVCSNILDGVNHDELLRRLKQYKLKRVAD